MSIPQVGTKLSISPSPFLPLLDYGSSTLHETPVLHGLLLLLTAGLSPIILSLPKDSDSWFPLSRSPPPILQVSNWFQHLHGHQLIQLLGFTSDILFASYVYLLSPWLTHSQGEFLVSAWPRAPFLRKYSAQASNLLNTTSYLSKTLRWFLLPHLIFRVRETSNPSTSWLPFHHPSFLSPLLSPQVWTLKLMPFTSFISLNSLNPVCFCHTCQTSSNLSWTPPFDFSLPTSRLLSPVGGNSTTSKISAMKIQCLQSHLRSQSFPPSRTVISNFSILFKFLTPLPPTHSRQITSPPTAKGKK